jgi:hypothetical protein
MRRSSSNTVRCWGCHPVRDTTQRDSSILANQSHSSKGEPSPTSASHWSRDFLHALEHFDLQHGSGHYWQALKEMQEQAAQ